MRIFLDANVLFSAAQTDGAVRKLIDRLRAADHQLTADSYVWEEARRNLVARYPSALPAFDALAGRINILPHRGGAQELKSLPVGDKDKPVLAAAISLNCRVLITGDRTHFGHLFGTAVRGVTIHSPALAARSLLS